MQLAFHGHAAFQRNALLRLQTRAAADQVTLAQIAWDGDKGSVVGCILEGEDLANWESELGLPKWLAYVIDATAAAQGSRQGAARVGGELLSAIAPGLDLRRRGSDLIVALLMDAQRSVALDASSPLAESTRHVVALHQSAGLGTDIPAPDWKAARRTATAVTDGVSDPLLVALASCVEAAAWEPERSRTAVLDTMRRWLALHATVAMQAYGWTAAHDDRMKARLDSLHRTYLKPEPASKKNVFELLEEHHPEEAAALLRRHVAQVAQAAASGKCLAAVVLDVLGLTEPEDTATPASPAPMG